MSSYYSSSESEADETTIKDFMNKVDESLKKVQLDDKDDANKFINDYLKQELWNKKEKPLKNDDESDDIEHTEEAIEFERKYNFRFEEGGSAVIESHPRKIEGEQRKNENARQRKRREDKEEKDIHNEEEQKRLDEIDEKYKKIFDEKGKLSPEEISAWVAETSNVIVEAQGGAFPYTETDADGGLARSLEVLNEEEKDDKPHKKNFKKRGLRPKPSNPRLGSYYSHRK